MARHPGKTPAQQRALDEIGCGNHSPIMAKTTRDALLRHGLIEELGEKCLPSALGPIRIRCFDMPIPVHMQWCAFQAEQSERTGHE